LHSSLDSGLGGFYAWYMQIQLSPERQAELNDYAERHGKDPEAALDEVLASALEWERQDYREAVDGIRKGYADFKAGRVRPVEEAFEALREKHGLAR
jgi:predicted transcriptional regulator